MTFTAGPWDGASWAEAQWRQFFSHEADRLLAVGSFTRSTSDRTVSLTGAVALIQGALAVQSGTDSLTVPVPSGSNQRIDYVCLEYNPTANTVAMVLVQGTESASPSAPDLSARQSATGNWAMPIFRLGPYGAGAIASAPALDFRLRPSRVRSATERGAGFQQGAARGDLLVLPPSDGGLQYHDGDTYLPYFQEPHPAEVFSSSDSGWPISGANSGGTTKITNQLTVPARSWKRVLQIDASHYLSLPSSTNQYDSLLFLGSDTPARRARHGRDTSTTQANTVTLHANYTLPAGRSLRIRLGFVQADGSGGSATSSGQVAYNNINVFAAPAE